MPEYYSLANVMLISLKKSDNFKLTIPAKFQSYLACGKPILSMTDGIINNLINKWNVGLTAESGNYKKLASNINKMFLMHEQELSEMSKNALIFNEKIFSRDKLINKAEKLFYEMI